MNIILFNIFILICSLIMISGCEKADKNNDLKIAASVQDVLIIGSSDEVFDDSKILSFIFDAVSDSEGSMYLVDPSTQYIHSYDNNSDYRWTIGGRGGGPGEFQNITSLYMDRDNHLYVCDGIQARVTIYDTDGNKQNVVSLDVGRRTIERIGLLPNGKLIIPYYNDDNEKLIHLYSVDDGSYYNSLVHIEEISRSWDELEKEFVKNRIGSALGYHDDLIIYVPEHYSGIIYLFQKNLFGNWHKLDEIEGYRIIHPSISFHITRYETHERSHMSGYNPLGSGYMHYEYHSISFGLFPKNDGTVVHISYISTDDGMQLVLEHFDIENRMLKSYSIIDELDIAFRPQKHPVWVDSDGYIYLADNSEWPKLRKLMVIYE